MNGQTFDLNWSTMDYLELKYNQRNAKRRNRRGINRGYPQGKSPGERPNKVEKERKRERQKASNSRTINRGGTPTTKR